MDSKSKEIALKKDIENKIKKSERNKQTITSIDLNFSVNKNDELNNVKESFVEPTKSKQTNELSDK